MEFIAGREDKECTLNDLERDAAQRIRAAFRGLRDRSVLIPRLRMGEPTCPFVCMPDSVIREIPRLAGITESDVVADLGCGDGRVVFQLGKFCGCRGRGCDIDASFVSQAKRTAERLGFGDRMSFEVADMMDYSLDGATVIVIFATPTVLAALAPKIQRDAAPGTRIVCYHFPFTTLRTAEAEIECTHPLRQGGPPTKLWLYTVPA